MPIPPVLEKLSPAEESVLGLRDPETTGKRSRSGKRAIVPSSPTDQKIVRRLDRVSRDDNDYWAFRRHAMRCRAHGLSQYPAMMVPRMQAVLVSIVAEVDGRVGRVLDPFIGSGTTLVECMRLGLNYAGQDINPLAVLICRAKAGPFRIDLLASAVNDVVKRAGADRGRSVEADFPGLDKWFCPDAIIELSRIRRAIRRVNHSWCRRVLWTGLAETVRLTCNSRTSTFKLHIRRAHELRSRRVDPLETFSTIVADITKRLREEATVLQENGHVSADGCYRGDIIVQLGDSAKLVPVVQDGHDLLVTSPPYGDNLTTVPYGQYSYLPLQWIDLHDIDDQVDSSYLRSTHEIDTRSLGGSQKNAVDQIQHLLAVSPSLRQTLRRLEQLPADRGRRVAAFCRDLDGSLRPMLEALRPSAYMIWTVGNRRVGGEPVPTDAILKELLAAKGGRLVMRIERKIPSKRMAMRNSIASTMRGETILVFRKA